MIASFGSDLIKIFVKNALKVKFCDYPQLDPLLLAYFITFRCNLNCTYCGYSNNGFKSRYRDMTTSEAKRIMKICREAVPAIAFSGGEPLVRKDIVEIVKFAKILRYKPISLFTNSLLLPYREEILDYIDFLQISLDTLNEKLQDKINGRAGVGKKVKKHIEEYSLLQKKKHFKININCVIGVHNLEYVPELIDFAIDNNVRLTVSPQLDCDGAPVKELVDGKIRKKYIDVIERILDVKIKTNVVLDIMPFLEHIKTFQSYECYPSLSARVYPDGSFIYPCPNLCNNIKNVLNVESWKDLWKSGGNNGRSCTKQCFLPCYLETSLLIKHPLSLIKELKR